MNIEEQIGNKIRDLRNQNGLTQEELADRTELTKGFISQLERGLTAPSIATLSDIANCLGITLSDFFKEDEESPIAYKKDDYFEKIDEHGNRIRWLIANAQRMQMEPILVDIKAGESVLYDKPHEGEEFGYVLSGTVYVHYGDRVYKVDAGDSFMYPADRSHYLRASSDGPATCLWISCPPNF